MFNALKDVALSKGLKTFANSIIQEYGEVLELNLNSKDKNIDLNIMLEGEREPLLVNIGRYTIIDDSGKKFIELDNITTSRIWLTKVAKDHINGKRFELPEQYSNIIEKLI